MTEPRFKRGDDVRHPRFEGVALWVIGYQEYQIENWDGEPDTEIDYSTAIVRMHGDDRDYAVDVTELEPLDEDDYCPECGQTGCMAYREPPSVISSMEDAFNERAGRML